MSAPETIFIDGPVGKLEALSATQEAPKALAIICHPHPLQQGTMHNKVVTTIHKACYEAGMNTVRFNYRGVGASEGSFADGLGETDDAVSILSWAHELFPELPIYLVGFSFGAYVSYRLAVTSDFIIKQLISIAPPVRYPEFQQLPTPTCPWLVVQGEDDDIVNPEAVYAWLTERDNPAQLIRVPDTGHFFHGKLIELKDIIMENLVTP